jgi:hypothetical protein
MLPALCGEGSPTYLFQRRSIPSSASGEASIGVLLLIAADYREMRIVGLLHPDAANPFNPQWLPLIPFVKFAGVFSHTNIATEWIQSDEGHRVATFPHRHLR